MIHRTIPMFPSDLWVVNLREGARIIACRAPWERNTVGQDFSEMLSEEERIRISSYLFSYEMKPTVSETVDGRLLIVIPSLMPSSTLAVVLAPQIDRKILLRFLAKRSGVEFVWSEAFADEAKGRMPGNVVKYEEALERLLWEIETLSFSALAPSRISKELRIDGFLKKRIRAISELAGCEVSLGEWISIYNSESFDFGIFTTFLLLSLLVFRTSAYERRVVVCMVEGVEDDRYLTVSAEAEETQDALSWEITTLEAITEERLMLFGTEYDGGQFSMKIIPRRIDVSYLGLKAKLRFQ